MPDSNRSAFTVIDTNWMRRPKSIGAVLVQSDGANAVIDPGPASTLETLRAELSRLGVQVADLHAILLTHIHLDHAGAVGALVKENAGISVFVHEFGAIHMADPSKLLASAGRLYGGEMDRLYGPMLPVPEENLQPLEGGEEIEVGKRDLKVLYTPGHASHHVTFWDSEERTAFVGDVGGICVEGDKLVVPPTPPPDIDIEVWNQSLDAIEELEPAR